MSEKDVKVKIPKIMVDFIHKHGLLEYYQDLEDFVLDCVRRRIESLMLLQVKRSHR